MTWLGLFSQFTLCACPHSVIAYQWISRGFHGDSTEKLRSAGGVQGYTLTYSLSFWTERALRRYSETPLQRFAFDSLHRSRSSLILYFELVIDRSKIRPFILWHTKINSLVVPMWIDSISMIYTLLNHVPASMSLNHHDICLHRIPISCFYDGVHLWWVLQN